MKTKIYFVCDGDGPVRYVGKTVQALSKRRAAHVDEGRLRYVLRGLIKRTTVYALEGAS